MSTCTAKPPSRSAISRAVRSALLLAFAAVVAGGCSDDSKRDNLADELIEQAAREAATAATAGEDTSGGLPITIPGIGGLGESEGGSSGDGSSASPSASTVPPVPVAIDKVVWWGGFKVTVASAVGSSNALSPTINVSVSLENLTGDVNRIERDDIILTVGAQSYLSGLASTPDVPAMSRNDAVLDFLVDDSFVVDDAVLTFGQPDSNQAVVPFGPTAASSFEPRQLAIDATLITPIETIKLAGGSIDASFAPGEKGTYIVRVPLQASYTGGSAGGDLLAPAQFALKMPSGAAVIGVPISPGDVVAEAVYTGQDVTNKSIAFKVDSADSGTWTITYTDAVGATATADFTVA